jgi:secondary thiamine-phosphate synthase enzyme
VAERAWRLDHQLSIRKAIVSSKPITIKTRSYKQVIDITDSVERVVAASGKKAGLCNVFVLHTTAGITTGEAIEGTDEDLMETLERIIPDMKFRHAHDPSHAPDHMISSILGPSLTVPIHNGKLMLGTWQRILLVECNGPRERELAVTVLAA